MRSSFGSGQEPSKSPPYPLPSSSSSPPLSQQACTPLLQRHYSDLLAAVQTFADGFLAINAKIHTLRVAGWQSSTAGAMEHL